MLLAIIFVALNLVTSFECTGLRRQKRYLVYPDGGPARVQFIIGLGVPVDLKEQSVTVGTVIKFQYDLPTNSSEYTTRIYGFADTVSRDMDGDVKETEPTNNDISDARNNDSENTVAKSNVVNDSDSTADSDETSTEENDALVDITFDDRKKRSLAFSEGGVINNNNIAKTELPLEEAIRRQELIDEKYRQQDEDLEPKKANRWDYYKIIEHMVERYGYTGRPCLLRTICEAAEVPFTHENGLLGEIGHILFTPSTTKDELSHHTDNEYHAAERLGRELGVDCETLFPECEGSVLDTFTTIGLNTLQKFGLV